MTKHSFCASADIGLLVLATPPVESAARTVYARTAAATSEAIGCDCMIDKRTRKIVSASIVRRFLEFEYKKLTCRSTSSPLNVKKKKPVPYF